VIEQYRLGFIEVHERACRHSQIIDLSELGWDEAAQRTSLEALKYVADHCDLSTDACNYLDYGFGEINRDLLEEFRALKPKFDGKFSLYSL